jgi:hypothetical protein
MTAHELARKMAALPPDTEVLVASQPQYPIRENIVAVSTVPSEKGVVWLATEQDYDRPYAPSGAWL